MSNVALYDTKHDDLAKVTSRPHAKIDHHHHASKAPADVLQQNDPLHKWLWRKFVSGGVVGTAKTLALATGGAVGAFSIALNCLPAWVMPTANAAAAAVQLQGIYEGVTNEPRVNTLGQGQLKNRMKYNYEFQMMGLTRSGGVIGRFRTDVTPQANILAPETEWWQLRGISDGKVADLTVSDSAGAVLGNIHIVKDTDGEGSIWAGHITAYDTSISAEGLVQSPILINPNVDDAKTKTILDPFLNEPSVLVKPHNS